MVYKKSSRHNLKQNNMKFYTANNLPQSFPLEVLPRRLYNFAPGQAVRDILEQLFFFDGRVEDRPILWLPAGSDPEEGQKAHYLVYR